MVTLACTQHVPHYASEYYYLFFCKLSALCTFVHNALIFNYSKSADGLRFYLHYHLHCGLTSAYIYANMREEKQQREGEKPIGATHFSTSRYSNYAVSAHIVHKVYARNASSANK